MFPTAIFSRVRRALARPQRSTRGQEGFTLAALIVILTIISVVIAYTVPEQWSLVMRRERERQTIFLMKQYARAIMEWERKHNSAPVSLDQLREARDPRMLRGDGEWINPLTGSAEDWILVPLQATQGGAAVPVAPGTNPATSGSNPATGGSDGVRSPRSVVDERTGQPIASAPGAAPGQPSRLNPDASPADYTGPFVAVRPNAKGESLLELNGATDYGEWVYTVADLRREIMARHAALAAK